MGFAVVLAGCGSHATTAGAPATQPTGAPRVVLAAYSQTIGSKTADVSISESVTEKVAGKSTQHVTVTGTGSIDFASQNVELSFSAPTTGTFAERFINPVLYIQVPASQRSQLSPGKSWAEVNLNTVTEAKLGTSLAQLSSSSQEPTQTLSYLQAISSNGITTVGPAPIRGTATTEYKATIDLTKVADQKVPAARAALKALEVQLHTTIMPVQVWLDAQGRARQVSYQLKESTTPSASSDGGTATPATSGMVTSTFDYFNFGAPVDVTAPPANQTDNITSQAVAAATSTTTGR